MKITGVRTQTFQHKLDRLIGGASAPQGYDGWAGTVVWIDTDEGITGTWVTFPPVLPTIRSLTPDLIGKDPRSVKGIWQDLVSKCFKFGIGGFVGHAISAIDIALWDVKAQANGEPLWRTLGASLPKVRACYSPIEMPLAEAELSAIYSKAAAQGITAAQVKVGIDQDRDMARLAIVENELKAAGRRPALGIDSNEHWSPKQAIRKIKEFEESFDLTWVEEPARRWDYRGLRKVSQSVRAAVASGENLVSIAEYMPLIDHQAIDMVQISHGTCGITGALQVADMAYGFDLPVMMLPSMGMAMVHLAAVIPNMTYMDVFDGGADKVFDSSSWISDGWVFTGEEAGHGLRVNEDRLQSFLIESDRVTVGGPSPYGRGWQGAGLYDEPLPPDNSALKDGGQ